MFEDEEEEEEKEVEEDEEEEEEKEVEEDEEDEEEEEVEEDGVDTASDEAGCRLVKVGATKALKEALVSEEEVEDKQGIVFLIKVPPFAARDAITEKVGAVATDGVGEAAQVSAGATTAATDIAAGIAVGTAATCIAVAGTAAGEAVADRSNPLSLRDGAIPEEGKMTPPFAATSFKRCCRSNCCSNCKLEMLDKGPRKD